MRRTALRIAALLALLVIVAFVVVMVNQTAQIVALAARVHPTFGQGVLWALIFTYAGCVMVPIALFVRLPKALVPPEADDAEAVGAHIERLRVRLAKNPELKGVALETREELEAALGALDARADEATRQAASQVFLTTAISQNGSLDAIVVLMAQSRLIYRVAKLYWQRPTLRDMVRLYGNVAGTALITSELEDIDLSEQLQPVLSTVVGSAAGAIPGFQTAATLIVTSVMTGSANAFLTLRVGIIARQYCAALVARPRGMVRRSASLQATQMLGSIAMTGARTVAGAVWSASKKSVGGTVTGVTGSFRRTGAALLDKLRPGAPGDPAEPGPVSEG